LALARQALAIDPSYAPAASLIAAIRESQSMAGIALSQEQVADAVYLARCAIETGRDDPEVLARGGDAIALLAGALGEGMSAIERAIFLNPNGAYGWRAAAAIHCYANRPDEAIDAIRRAMRLSPLDPATNAFKWILGYALMQAGRYDEANEWIDRSLHDRPSFHAAIRGKVAVLGYLGRTDEAKEWIDRLLLVNPVHTIAWFKAFGGKFLSAATLAIWVEGLRRAGLPEG
jgi:adenylate cyclase